jgi:hypothetical protein
MRKAPHRCRPKHGLNRSHRRWAERRLRFRQRLFSNHHLWKCHPPLCHPDPDFLPRSTGQGRVCASPWRKAHEVHQRRKSQQEIRGSAAAGPAVRPGSRTKVWVSLVLTYTPAPSRTGRCSTSKVRDVLTRTTGPPRYRQWPSCSARFGIHCLPSWA